MRTLEPRGDIGAHDATLYLHVKLLGVHHFPFAVDFPFAFFFLAFALAAAAFLARCVRASGVMLLAAALPPRVPPIFPPFLPASRKNSSASSESFLIGIFNSLHPILASAQINVFTCMGC